MFFIPLVVSLTSLLCSVPVSCCDEKCADKPVFTPSRLIVKYGDSVSATCTVCPNCTDLLNLERAVGNHTTNKNKITWKVNSLTEWSTTPLCFYSDGVKQCCSALPVSAYKPPDNVSLSFTWAASKIGPNQLGPMREGRHYTLWCDVKNVAPVQNLVVTFYRGQSELAGLNISNSKKEPVSEVFSLNITASRDDDEAQFSCEAKLELGPDGPQHPPVVKSQHITATVHYKPHVERSSHPDPVVVTVGDRLQLNCSAEGNPPPSFTWWLPGHQVNEVAREVNTLCCRLSRHHKVSTLTIGSVTVQDEGQYVCQITNYLDSVNATFNVKVKELTSTSLPPTTTTTTTATTTTPTTTTTTTTTPTTTTATTTQTTTTKRTNTPSSSTSISPTHWVITWFMILFSLVI